MRHACTYALFCCAILTTPLAGVAAAEDALTELVGWIKATGGSARELAAWPELQVDGGTAFRAKNAVYLKLTNWPASNKVAIARLNNPTRNVYLLGQPDAQLRLKPEPSKWIINLPKTLPQGAEAVVVVQTIGEPHLPQVSDRIAADDAGAFKMPAHEAVTHGKMLRYEPQPHKNTVGYWTKPTDWTAWRLDVKRSGRYSVHILQGCGKGHGGSEVGIHLRQTAEADREGGVLLDPVLRFVVQDTGHFQNFVSRELGQIEFETAGDYTLEIRPERLANKAVMDVREVRLVPVDEK